MDRWEVEHHLDLGEQDCWDPDDRNEMSRALDKQER